MRALVYWAMGGIGGVQRMYAIVTKALMDCGYGVDILTSYRIDRKKIIEMDGVDIGNARVITTKRVTCNALACATLNATISTIALTNIINNYDLIYLDTFYLPYLVKHKNIIFYIHWQIDRKRPIAPIAKPHRMFPLAILALGSDYRRALRNARHVFANSYFTAYVTYRTLGIMPKILYPPVDIDLVSKHRSVHRENAIVSFGRIGSAKGHDIAIKIVKALKELGIDAKAYILGAADISSLWYIKSLQNMARKLGVDKEVEIITNPSISKVYEILGRSKVYIHGKSHEPFGITVVEAMAAGAVPVVPKSGGPWHDILRHGKYGFGYEHLDELIYITKQLLTNEISYSEYSKIAIKRAETFSYSNFVNRLCNEIMN